MPAAVPSDTTRILNSLRRLFRALRVYSRQVEQRTGLTAAQLFVMQKLRTGSPLSLNALSRHTETDLSTVSVVVDRLAKKGLLIRRRSATDARTLEIRLSAKGRSLILRREDALQTRLIGSITSLKPSGRKSLAEGLGRLLERAGLSKESPFMFFEPEEK
jgi:DNA-binding MarR family transcriptional regulator